MPETVNEEKTTTKNDQWRERIAKQERSGLSVRQFCEDQGLTEYSFYAWRKRLRGAGPVRFALVKREERCGKSLRPRQVWNWCWLPALPSAERTAYPRFSTRSRRPKPKLDLPPATREVASIRSACWFCSTVFSHCTISPLLTKSPRARLPCFTVESFRRVSWLVASRVSASPR
jgi:hypothetical protein